MQIPQYYLYKALRILRQLGYLKDAFSRGFVVISLLAAVGVGVIVYLVLCYMFKVEEVRNVVGKVRNKFRG